MMKIFYSGLRNDKYDPQGGDTFEHHNFYLSLTAVPDLVVRYFPFDRILEIGRRGFNEEILEAAKKERPDLLFVFMLSDEFEKETLSELRKYTTTLAWFADDNWRFWNYSRFWANCFDWVVTTISWVPDLYRKIGQKNVIRSQWAANTGLYHPIKLGIGEERPSVTFVGGWSRPRQKIISGLGRRGIEVKTCGSGWSDGRVSDEEMIRLFSVSKINLALNPPQGYFNKNSLGRLFFRRSINRIVPDFHFLSNFETWLHRNIPQIKARHFEIPACGGFAITSKADDLKNFYKPGEEMVIYDGPDDLADKLRYYLEHDDEREKIVRAGYERTIRDHTYEKRFREIFDRIFK